MNPINLFIDTEFTDFKNCQLVSIALVKNESEYLYLESSSFNPQLCSEFVNKNVLPLRNTQTMPIEQIKIKINEWLDLQESDEIVILGDWPGDWKIFTPLLKRETPVCGFVNVFDFFYSICSKKLLNTHPAHIQTAYEQISERFSFYTKEWFQMNNKKEHHALDDALSNYYAFDKTLANIDF